MSIVINDGIGTKDERLVTNFNFTMSSGDVLKLEATDYNDPLIGTVPEGKQWLVQIRFDITETPEL